MVIQVFNTLTLARAGQSHLEQNCCSTGAWLIQKLSQPREAHIQKVTACEQKNSPAANGKVSGKPIDKQSNREKIRDFWRTFSLWNPQ